MLVNRSGREAAVPVQGSPRGYFFHKARITRRWGFHPHFTGDGNIADGLWLEPLAQWMTSTAYGHCHWQAQERSPGCMRMPWLHRAGQHQPLASGHPLQGIHPAPYTPSSGWKRYAAVRCPATRTRERGRLSPADAAPSAGLSPRLMPLPEGTLIRWKTERSFPVPQYRAPWICTEAIRTCFHLPPS